MASVETFTFVCLAPKQEATHVDIQALTRDAVIKDRILGTPGVTAITEYSSNFDGNTRRFSVTATITTAYGTAQVDTTL